MEHNDVDNTTTSYSTHDNNNANSTVSLLRSLQLAIVELLWKYVMKEIYNLNVCRYKCKKWRYLHFFNEWGI